MPLLSLRDITHRFSSLPVFDSVSFAIEKGERVGLLGRNGAGKSTLMNVVDGTLVPEEGVRDLQDGLRIGRLIQDLPSDREGTVLDVVSEAFGKEAFAVASAARGDVGGLEEADMERLWASAHAAQREISRLELDADMAFSACSGGQRRRALLAQALAREPDVLLLDEPTNHLDISSIEWLEEFLLREQRTLLFVTHDRAFLRRVATRIVELDRGQLRNWTCDYRTYLERREQWLEDEAIRREKLDKKIDQEAIWAAKNVQARRTKSVGRLRALEALRKERAQQRARVGSANIDIQSAEKSGKIVAKLKNVRFTYDDGPDIVTNLSTIILRGDRLGIVGPNGAGKTTLARLVLGELAPTSGTVKTGTKLQVVYFDQRRDQLDLDASVARNVADENDRVTVGGKTRHVFGYLRDFLFTDERSKTPARYLSGGEKNRLLLAKLFLKPANVLVLDEPTNDLDAETLELLEERVADFGGTIIVISHDRAFLDAVATNTLIAEGEGRWEMYAGGYSEAQTQRRAVHAAQIQEMDGDGAAGKSKKEAYRAQQKAKRQRKLTYKEQEELKGMEAHIETLENDIETSRATLEDPKLYVERPDAVQGIVDRLEELEHNLETAFERWELLESIQNGTFEGTT